MNAMPDTITWLGTYTDESGTVPITVVNDFTTLSFEVDGVKFSGREFAGMGLADVALARDEITGRFSFSPISIYGTNEVSLELCDCSISVIIPQVMVDTKQGIEINVELSLTGILGYLFHAPASYISSAQYELAVSVNGQTAKASSVTVEHAMLQIQQAFDMRYLFKNCYGCMYGDYWVGGNAAFGSMRCYVRQKEKYMLVTNKSEYMELDSSGCPSVQETFCCKDFEFRKPGIGYRD